MPDKPKLVFKNFKHQHVSEREKEHFWPDGQHDDFAAEDCLWCAAIEILRFGGLDVDATPAEAEAMRAASGEPPAGPSSPANLIEGAKARYGITLKTQSGNAKFWERFPVGSAAIISGKLKAFPEGSTLRQHQRSSVGPHAVTVFRYDNLERAWWCDPLATRADWPGVRVSRAQIEAFMAQLPNPYFIVAHNQFAGAGANGGMTTAANVAAKKLTGMIRLTFAGKPAGSAVANRIGHAFDMETRGARAFQKADAFKVVAEVKLAETLSKSLPSGELMLLASSGPNGRFEIIRAVDTDWPKSKA